MHHQYDFSDLIGNRVIITLKSGRVVTGVLREVLDDYLSLAPLNGGKPGRIAVHRDSISWVEGRYGPEFRSQSDALPYRVKVT